MIDAVAHIAGIKLDDYYQNADACIEVLRKGRPMAREVFGTEAWLPGFSTPPISYGHIHCLGAGLRFPEDSEPGVRPVYASIEEGIAGLQKNINFKENELFKKYLDMYRLLKKEFPGENVSFGFSAEGPVTTAVLLRGQNFYIDLYEKPEKAKEFLDLVVKSIIGFELSVRDITGGKGYGIADDFTSLLPPDMWKEFVIPYWDKLYTAFNVDRRILHVENLTRKHLKNLAAAGISFYNPEVSPKLTPAIIREEVDIPFDWELPAFRLISMSTGEVRQWVEETVADGVKIISTHVFKAICEDRNVEKIRAFIDTAKKMAAGS